MDTVSPNVSTIRHKDSKMITSMVIMIIIVIVAVIIMIMIMIMITIIIITITIMIIIMKIVIIMARVYQFPCVFQGMFVVVARGLAAGFLTWCSELVINNAREYRLSTALPSPSSLLD